MYIINYSSECCDEKQDGLLWHKEFHKRMLFFKKLYKRWKYPVIIKPLNISYFCAVFISKPLTDFCHRLVPSPELPALHCDPVTWLRKVK